MTAAVTLEQQARRWLIRQGIPTSGNCASLTALLVRMEEQARRADKQLWINDAVEPLRQELDRIKDLWSEFQELMKER